ncbi:MAG: hypothetical protein ACYTKD_18310 [Planctomycetota bacterium]
MPCRELPVTYGSPKDRKRKGDGHIVYEYSLSLQLSDPGYRAMGRALHEARSLTWTEGAKDFSELPFHVPGDTVVSAGRTEGAWRGAHEVAVRSFRPAGVKHWYVLSAYADLPREQMQAAMRPTRWAVIGRRIGEAAAEEARGVRDLGRVDVAGGRTLD